MRIAIDASSVPSLPAGAGVYAIELVRGLAALACQDEYALFIRGRWADKETTVRPNWHVEHNVPPSRVRRLAWEQVALPRRLSSLEIDVLHSTHHTLPLRRMRARRAVTIHDLTFFRIPRRYPLARRLYMQTLTHLALRAADAIIVPSQAVREDLSRIGVARHAAVSVIHEAPACGYAPVVPEEAVPVARRYGAKLPYVLSVGSREPGKNRLRLIRAIARLRDEGFPHQLVVVGQKAWSYDREDSLVNELALGDRIVFAGYVPQDHMPALYSAATAVAYPSLYEGFGLCVLEAMACGTPVLTSNVSATAEVGEGAALLVDPHSVTAITDGLRSLLTGGSLHDDLRDRGIARASLFSWSRAAEETSRVYHTLAGPRGRS